MKIYNKNKVCKLIASLGVLIGVVSANQVVNADADIAVQPAGTATEATTNVDICVVIPEILIFGVGAVGDSVAKIKWDITASGGTGTGNNQTYSGAEGAFTSPDPFSATPTASIVSNGGTGASVSTNIANLPVFLFSNNGSDVTITSATSGGTTGGGTADALDESGAGTNTIPISDFTASQLGSVMHPDLASTSTADTAHTLGVVNLADTWTYTYTPSTIPAAGLYEARITYTAAQP